MVHTVTNKLQVVKELEIDKYLNCILYFNKLRAVFNDFRVLLWIVVAVRSVLSRSSHLVELGSIADVSEIYAASIFRVQVCRASQCSCIYTLSHLSYSDPANGGSIYIRNIVGTANFHNLQRPKSRTSTDIVCKDVGRLRTTS